MENEVYPKARVIAYNDNEAIKYKVIVKCGECHYAEDTGWEDIECPLIKLRLYNYQLPPVSCPFPTVGEFNKEGVISFDGCIE